MRPKWSRSGKNLGLQRQEGPARVHQVDAGQPVFQGDFLGAQVFLHRNRVVGTALDGRVVGRHHHFPAVNHADARDDSSRLYLVFVHPQPGQGTEFQERGVGIRQPVDALPDGQLPPAAVEFHGTGAAALPGPGQTIIKFRHQLRHFPEIFGELGAVDVNSCLDDIHVGFPCQVSVAGFHDGLAGTIITRLARRWPPIRASRVSRRDLLD